MADVNTNDINRIIAIIPRVTDDVAYTQSIKFRMEQQTDGTYKFVISERYEGRRWNENA